MPAIMKAYHTNCQEGFNEKLYNTDQLLWKTFWQLLKLNIYNYLIQPFHHCILTQVKRKHVYTKIYYYLLYNSSKLEAPSFLSHG
jgi:hypothetical protein